MTRVRTRPRTEPRAQTVTAPSAGGPPSPGRPRAGGPPSPGAHAAQARGRDRGTGHAAHRGPGAQAHRRPAQRGARDAPGRGSPRGTRARAAKGRTRPTPPHVAHVGATGRTQCRRAPWRGRNTARPERQAQARTQAVTRTRYPHQSRRGVRDPTRASFRIPGRPHQNPRGQASHLPLRGTRHSTRCRAPRRRHQGARQARRQRETAGQVPREHETARQVPRGRERARRPVGAHDQAPRGATPPAPRNRHTADAAQPPHRRRRTAATPPSTAQPPHREAPRSHQTARHVAIPAPSHTACHKARRRCAGDGGHAPPGGAGRAPCP
ncbi:hypothetical protein HNP84_008383 [Thermocatellispora tengchongensis]|uniref:Uncharacterized protein n=1 Tax=Thermocatellispora tengchongensis TaxID=1073253 RepID=A0A840PI25_9ACTN|nr:hypothetical protein [Thermocatellispora tengchongensis]